MWRGALLLATLPMLLAGCASREAPRAAAPAVSSASTPSPLSVISPVVRYTLPNGLVVLLNEDHRVPLVAVRVAYRVGAADPPGLAHLTEHLLFQGSRNVPGRMHWTYLDRAGASAVNATTRWDTTELFEVVPAAELELSLWLEGERMAFGLEGLSQAVVDKEHRIVLLEHGERVDNVAGGRFDDLISGELFPRGHPYHVSVGGRAPPPPRLADVQAFHRDHFGPNNALLVLSGDFEPKRAQALIERHFGQIAPRPLPHVVRAASPAPALGRTLRIQARVPRPQLVISWATPAKLAPGNAELDILTYYLRLRLHDELIASGLALEHRVEQDSARLGSMFQIFAGLRRDASPDPVIDAVDRVLGELTADGIAREAIQEATRDWVYRMYIDHDDILLRTWLIAESQRLAGTPAFIEHASARYGAVTPASIREVVAQQLARDKRVIAIVTPDPKAPLAGKLAMSQ